MKTITAVLHDGAKIDVEISGSGAAILLPVNPVSLTGEEAEAKQKWGVNPALGRRFIDGLNDTFTVIAFDYEGFRMQHPAAETLTPDNIVKDFLAVADAAGVEKFAYYGYSWLALCALQLGIRTDRLWALIMGAYPPIDGPYKEMWAVTKATYEMALHPEKQDWPAAEKSDDEYDWDAAELSLSGEQTKQFFTLYNALQDFDDRAVQSKLTCPRLCFVGSNDKQEYSEKWGGVTVDMATPLIKRADELKKYGWDVQVLDGLDHISAMQPTNALPVIRQWLVDKA
jgi:pimeloyl-ACP methyl ester carboxylesterase